MRVESKVTSISWIPSEAVEGLPKVPFTMGIAHYDDAPPDRLVDIDLMHRADQDRKSTRLNSSHSQISYAVFCLKKKNKSHHHYHPHHATSPSNPYQLRPHIRNHTPP